jgi:hypothetical protein
MAAIEVHMTAECKTWPDKASAVTALNAVKAAWLPPKLTWVNCAQDVRDRLVRSLGTMQIASDPVELSSGRWAVVADHPGFKGEVITGADRVQAAEPAAKQGVK